MLDYSLIYFILFFIFWIFLIDITLENKNKKAYRILQFIFSIPLIISIANNAYVSSFIFGYVFCLVIGIFSVYIMVENYIE